MRIKDTISGALLIAGTAVGAGMLGIPLITAQCGILFAVLITILVWVFMLLTGFLFLDATLWMPTHSNLLSMAKRFIHPFGKIFSGITFLFLYYCLLVAYFAGGAPILVEAADRVFHISLAGWKGYFAFAVIFGAIVHFGLKFINKVNFILMIGLIVSYLLLIAIGTEKIAWDNFLFSDIKMGLFAFPILFSAFGFHNVVPSLTFHFEKDIKVMKQSIFWGTFLALIIYLIWQLIIIGVIPREILKDALLKGVPATEALRSLTGSPSIVLVGRLFGFFALTTSLIGVAFSMVDFIGDGLNMKRVGKDRLLLCFLTFAPAFLFTSLNPDIFVLAIGIAGGFGEAVLNGLLPIIFVWRGKYKLGLPSTLRRASKKSVLVILAVFSIFVILSEIIYLIYN